ncbi:MAG: ribosome biogenesis protein [Thermofilum sp. ex4484_82]|nr:RNA-protein complex protein Nop10 [Thermoproteales archaeon]OYT25635.1 MAG: ribosome biogenesis protein [Thermofilum sp. ex4484_82]OYT36149.1 MAG: ribosome biogenesis protein [Archaeoglobales archaeon ex4484_92]RLE77024.1 MAG: RNA-protein complex protein Nop10 [Thermoprotei archaeon]RLE86070.1 MAG: RNA-protein complex protein Nop10 [Thermoprotei archaeon]
MVRKGILRMCKKCGKYTLKQDKCPYCGGPVRVPHPPKFSPEDKWGEYRRKIKLASLIQKKTQDK